MKLVDEQIVRVLAVVSVTISLIACHKTGRPLKSADASASMIENIVHMGGLAENSRVPAATIIATLQRLWILYADLEMTCSTAAFLHVASTQADPISSFIAAVAAGYGPLHGGAIDTAYSVMREVGTTDQVPELIAKVKRKECRLFGYGHRTYKRPDPRAEAIKEILHDLTREVPVNELDPFLKVAFEIDRVASSDDYFTARKLFANADLYGSFVYTALGIPTELITPLVMVSRSPGVLAQWRESVGKFTAHTLYFCRRRGLTDFNIGRAPAIWRPQQIYTGSETGSTSGNDHYIRTKAPRSPDNKEKAPSSKL
jgi:citrate synthase